MPLKTVVPAYAGEMYIVTAHYLFHFRKMLIGRIHVHAE